MVLKWRRVMLEENNGRLNTLKDYLIGYSQSEEENQFFIEQSKKFLENERCRRIIIEKADI